MARRATSRATGISARGRNHGAMPPGRENEPTTIAKPSAPIVHSDAAPDTKRTAERRAAMGLVIPPRTWATRSLLSVGPAGTLAGARPPAIPPCVRTRPTADLERFFVPALEREAADMAVQARSSVTTEHDTRLGSRLLPRV